jgi:hypothetical protein
MNGVVKRSLVLGAIAPVVNYGLQEAGFTSVQHAMYEIAAISFLMGQGYDFQTAHMIVESWEVGEAFPPYQSF